MKTLHEISEILLKSGYLQFQISNSTTTNKFIHNIKFLPLGSIFLNKIQNEWYQNRGSINTYSIPNNTKNNSIQSIKNLENQAYIKSENFHRNFLHVKENFQKELPLAIKEEFNYSIDLTEFSHEQDQKEIITSNEGDTDHEKNNDDDNLKLNFENGTLLTTSYFINEKLSTEYFYKIQRERKIWWMKLSSNPGRYFLTDLKTNQIKLNGNTWKSYSIKIKSKFTNFGNIELENIHVIPLKALNLNKQNEFYLKDTRLNRRVIPAIVRTELQLETAAMGFLLDSVEDSKTSKMNLSRKIAPYQCALFCLSEDEKSLSELMELATHLANVIRKVDISVLNLPKCCTTNENTLKKELNQMDRIGVPYSLILESNSLQNGLMKLRNRDTTISETIHISDIPNYLLKILQI